MVRPRLANGAVIDGFTIGELVHTGGMAMLWSVTHPDHPEPLLMKVPRLFEGEDPAAIVSFEMETMILPRLKGPHVPRCIATADFEVQPYIVMERVPGTSLLPKVAGLPLPIEEVAEIGAKVADALGAVHRQYVIHLDVKPSNILFRPSGEAVLIDYGLSHHDQLPDLMEEEFRLPYGTAPYMAPEQIMGIRSEPRSDLFALGAMLYFFTTGTRPFGDPQRLSGLKRRLWWDPQPPRVLRRDCPPWLQEVILRCLEVEPERRPASPAQLAFDLRHPAQVPLTARSEKLARDPWSKRVRRRFNPDYKPRFTRPAAEEVSVAPIILVAVDLAEQRPAIAEALRTTIGHVLSTVPGARVACVNVWQQKLIGLDSTLDAHGHNKHVQRLVELKHWAAPLRLPDDRITFHVLEATNPADALLDYARTNNVDHIVIGASARTRLSKMLGSVSRAVAAQAPCTVTVVRPRVRVEETRPEAAASLRRAPVPGA